MKKLFLALNLLILSSCVGASREDVAKIHKIGVLAETGDKVDIVFVGTTVFSNGVDTIELKNSNFDQRIENDVINALDGQYQVISLDQYRGKLQNKYNANPGFGNGWFDYKALPKELAQIGRDNGLDTVIYISPRSGEFGAKYAHVLNTRDFIGSENTVVASNLYAFLVNVDKQETLYNLDSFNITGSPISRMMTVKDPDLSSIIPSNADNLTPQQKEKLEDALQNNLDRVVPVLVKELIHSPSMIAR